MSDNSPANETPNGSGEDDKAPWGDDFDQDRAWRLIQNLRADLDKVKGERDTLAKERQDRDDAEKSEAEKLTGKLTKAEQDFKEAQRALFIERALRKHSIDEDLVEFLTGDTEDEITAKAERLASLGKKEEEEPSGDQDASQKPKPALRPGHGGEESNAPFDADAVANAARKKASY